MFPCGQDLPLASTLNSIDGRVKAGAAIVPAGANGGVSAFATNDTELILDINGYFVPASNTSALEFYPLTPCRIVDTRNPAGSQPFNGTRNVDVVGSGCGVPASAQSLVLNATVVPPGPLGFLTLWAQGATQPVVST